MLFTMDQGQCQGLRLLQHCDNSKHTLMKKVFISVYQTVLHLTDIPLYLRQIIDYMLLNRTFISTTDIVKLLLVFFVYIFQRL